MKCYDKETFNAIKEGYFKEDNLVRLTDEKEEENEREAVEALKDNKGLLELHYFFKEKKIEDKLAQEAVTVTANQLSST